MKRSIFITSLTANVFLLMLLRANEALRLFCAMSLCPTSKPGLGKPKAAYFEGDNEMKRLSNAIPVQ
ncbi:unnamed protein product [Ranitomeya imitator]|uniref:Secreted protein n=1 Tax=Ranitomeya imitator TaxID=111125 RepID=A0ABN9M4B2_9NEOB|nr:unnamed protein product [Ranitomeya imitator]